MFDGATSYLDIDDLAMAASDLLDQFRKRGMDDAIQRSVVKKTFKEENLEKLRELVAKFEAAIQDHDAEVAAAQAALVEREIMNGIHNSNESFPLPSAHETKPYGPYPKQGAERRIYTSIGFLV
jgi:lysyl-tRNA synthetase class II